MNSIFCHSCGTLIAENEEFCSACGRAMDWRNQRQLDYYVQPKRKTRQTAKQQEGFPSSIFSENKNESVSLEQKSEPMDSPQQSQEIYTEKSWIIKEPAPQEQTTEVAVLSFGEMVLLIVCAFVPILGTIILGIASFVGNKQQNANRQTAAKALLLAQLVVILTVVIFFIFFFQYVMLLLPFQQFLMDW